MLNATDDVHICNYLTNAAPRSGPLFIHGTACTDLATAQQRVASLAHALRHHAHLQDGDRVSILARTTPAHLEAILAITSAGCISAPLNWRWGVEEATHAADLVEPAILFVDTTCLTLALAVAQASRSIRAVILLGETLNSEAVLQAQSGVSMPVLGGESLINSTPLGPVSLPAVHRFAPERIAFLLFTSGTSGLPRAAALTHSAMHFQCCAKLQRCGYCADDVYLHSAPLFHVGGLCSALAMLLAGAAHVFLPAFSAGEALRLVQMHGVTATAAVPTMVADLLKAAGPKLGTLEATRSVSFRHRLLQRASPTETLILVAGLNNSDCRLFPVLSVLPSMKTVLLGAGGTPPDHIRRLAALMPSATLSSAYGMTEGCSSLTFSTLRTAPALEPVAPPPPPPGAEGGVYVGRPPHGIELGVIEMKGGAHSCNKPGEDGVGEVVTRGPHMALRYWRDSAATAASFLPEEWFRTGDFGALRGGHLWLVGRVKDTVKSGGENVAAAEVERAVLNHPGVAAAAVVGLPNERLGEVVVAAVVLQQGWAWQGSRYQGAGAVNGRRTGVEKVVDAIALQEHCRALGLAGFKLPRAAAVVDSLPVNAMGKVVKDTLKKQLLGMQADSVATGSCSIRSKL